MRYPDPYWGNRLVSYCERCRIKDGLGAGRMHYGTCSYCGRVTMVYSYNNNTHWSKTVANKKSTGNGWGRWVRGPAIWLGHGKKRKK